MEWKIYGDPIAFGEAIETLLYEEEDRNSLFLGILNQVKSGRHNEYFLGLAEEAGEVLAAVLMTPPHPLQMIVFDEKAGLLTEIAQQLAGGELKIPGVIGDNEAAHKFAQAWASETGDAVELKMDEGLYRVDAVVEELDKSAGSWRVANKQDAELLEKWYLLFEKDTRIGASTQQEAEQKVGKFLDDKEVYVWEERGEVVSCMKKSRPSRNGISVGFVFTPREHRKKGYARTLVAEVTEELLLEFDFVMLYTDLQNPISNKIYKEIGYKQIANPVHIEFS